LKASMKLPVLEDYAFLSDLNSGEFFIIQRSGEIWRQDGSERWSVPSRKFENAFCNWKEILGDNCRWSWLKGWLPVLQIKNETEKQIRLLAKNDSLWIENENLVTAYPEKIKIPPAQFEEEIRKIDMFWNAWFSKGWMPPEIHPYIDSAWKSSFVQSRMAYSAKHPHYGAAYYGKCEHDGFPPTTLSMVSALLDYGHITYAQEILSYFLERYMLPDGNLDYYGTSVSELGGLLILCARMPYYEGGNDWLKDHLSYLTPLFHNLLRKRNPVSSQLVNGLIIGSPEADQRKDCGAFFHNNAFAWRAFEEWSKAMGKLGLREAELEALRNARELKRDMDAAIQSKRNSQGLIPSRVDKEENFKSFTESREAAYANYRYYPEMLETGMLSTDDAYAIIKAREEMNGELCGMTYLGYADREYHFDNWTLASYARGLLELNDRKRFMNAFFSHALYHQTQDTFTAYEQVTEKGNPRRAYADWCVPSQLVLPKMLAWSFNYIKWNGETVQWNGPDKNELNQYMPF